MARRARLKGKDLNALSQKAFSYSPWQTTMAKLLRTYFKQIPFSALDVFMCCARATRGRVRLCPLPTIQAHIACILTHHRRPSIQIRMQINTNISTFPKATHHNVSVHTMTKKKESIRSDILRFCSSIPSGYRNRLIGVRRRFFLGLRI